MAPATGCAQRPRREGRLVLIGNPIYVNA